MKKKLKRKSSKAEVRIPFPNMVAVFVIFGMVFALSYVSLCARCETLGSEIRRLEKDLASVQKQVIIEQDRWSNMLAPTNFERALKRHGLNMSLPDERQIVRVRSRRADSVLTLAASRSDTQFDAL